MGQPPTGGILPGAVYATGWNAYNRVGDYTGGAPGSGGTPMFAPTVAMLSLPGGVNVALKLDGTELWMKTSIGSPGHNLTTAS